ncbi:MAG: YbjN domain-containing protein [Deltaproteobacteria bacterium]|nr:YbjN domain-containing protein [Deltaproteobacteria bacterium]
MEDVKAALTEAQREDAERVVKMVETHLASEGLILEKVRIPTKDGHPAWAFVQGSALVRIHLVYGSPDMTANYLQVVAPVILLPDANTEALYRRLLSLNADELWMCSFAIRDDTVLVTADRTTLDLDLSEVVEMIERVAVYGDRFDDELAKEFGAMRYSDAKAGGSH